MKGKKQKLKAVRINSSDTFDSCVTASCIGISLKQYVPIDISQFPITCQPKVLMELNAVHSTLATPIVISATSKPYLILRNVAEQECVVHSNKRTQRL